MSELRLENRRKAYLVTLSSFWLSILSVFLLYPICLWYKTKYFTNRKYIDGKKLVFEGEAIDMYLIFTIGLAIATFLSVGLRFALTSFFPNIPVDKATEIPNSLFSLLISFFVVLQERRYIQKNIHFEGEEEKKSGFTVNIFWMVLRKILLKVLSLFTLGLLMPLQICLETYYEYHRGYISGHRFSYRLSLKKLYPRWFLDLFLSIITFGFYFFAALNRLEERNMGFVHIKEDKKRKRKKSKKKDGSEAVEQACS